MRISSINSTRFNYNAPKKSKQQPKQSNDVSFGRVSPLARQNINGYLADQLRRHGKEPIIMTHGWYVEPRCPMWNEQEEEEYAFQDNPLAVIERSNYMHLKKNRITGALYLEFDKDFMESNNPKLAAAKGVARTAEQMGEMRRFQDMLINLDAFDDAAALALEVDWCAKHGCVPPPEVYTAEEMKDREAAMRRNSSVSSAETEEEYWNRTRPREIGDWV